MKKLLVFAVALVVSGCATSSGASLDDIVRGPARVCMERSSFNLPVGGTIVEATPGRLGINLAGMIGPSSFEVTESSSFAALGASGPVVYRGSTFIVRQIGDLPGSYAVFTGSEQTAAQQPIVRIEHYFSTETATVEQFFAGFDPAGAAAGGCQRVFRYGS